MTKEKLVLFINKVTDELVSNELKSNEILRKYNYFVSDIVIAERFVERSNQKIIKSANLNIQKILSEIFGKNNIPQIGKNRNAKNESTNDTIIADNKLYPIEKIGNKYIQLVNISSGVFRAYSNCFYWLKHKFSDENYRNLGYYSLLQTNLMNIFKSFIIDYLLSKKRTNKMIRDFSVSDDKYIIKLTDNNINEYLEYISKSIIPKYIGIIDLYILNQLHHIPIILYDIYDKPFIIIDNGFKYVDINSATLSNTLINKTVLDKYLDEKQNYINIKYSIIKPTLSSSISNIYSLYFL